MMLRMIVSALISLAAIALENHDLARATALLDAADWMRSRG